MILEQLKATKIELIKNESKYIDNYSLANGSTGISLFFYEYGKFTDDNEAKEIAINLFLKQLYAIGSAKNSDLSLFGGMTGVYWLYQYYINEDVLESEDGLLLSFDNLLEQQIDQWSEQKNFELLFGMSGIATYHLERYKYTKREDSLVKIYHSLKKSLQTKNNIDFWMDSESPELINLGVAHGIIGCLNFYFELINILSSKDIKKEISQSINNIILLLESISFSSPKTESIFPCQIKNKYFEGYPSRVGWCYGDLMIGYSFLKYSSIHNNDKISKLGYEIIEHFFNRDLTSISAALQDRTICHGTRGVFLILTMLKYNSSDEELKCKIEKKLIELEKLEKKIDKELNGPYTYILQNGLESFQLNLGLLEGIAGHGLSHVINEKNMSWTKILSL